MVGRKPAARALRVLSVNAADCEACEGTGRIDGICYGCNGSGEGKTEYTSCPDCGGSGAEVFKCPDCDGTGDNPTEDVPDGY